MPLHDSQDVCLFVSPYCVPQVLRKCQVRARCSIDSLLNEQISEREVNIKK